MPQSTPTDLQGPKASSTAAGSTLSAEGYKKTLSRRHVTMIAMGGAIGVGLFMGAGGRLASTGPALIFSYAIAGVIAYLLMRALGELIMYRQTSGSFVSYAGEMFGKKGAFLSGWMYFINWAMTGIAELIAIGLYFQFFFPNVPIELSAIAALVLLVAVNLFSVKAFGEFEFWASCLKVAAIVIFLAVGTFMVVTNAKVGDGHASVANLFHEDGGMFPKGGLVMILVLNAVIFAYNAIELVGITAGEMENPEREVPKAIRAVVFRIVVFYVGSVTLLAMLLPSDQYVAGTSPFVTVFGQMGLGWMGDVMNMIVITAALSSCNSGLYSIGRIFRTMANNGHAPQWLTKMSTRHVPYAAILAIGGVYLVGILLNIWLGGSHAFDLALNTASIGVIFTWGSIFASQIALRKKHGKVSSLPMPGSPWTSWLGLVALLAITVLIGFDTMTDKATGEVFLLGLWTLATIPFFALVLWLGWQKVKNNQPKSELFS
ncbi:L-asparagine permease [Paenarthrobacter nicotinovorans]|uniref:amino acid permease n=1 Tax=Paenarthrobacter nicotinovorans TaxID=29320 RepID=UPI0007CD06F7|nr:amino acid permease [Paenarthrobacter nicotinovorans]GAT85458.1 L-asparagine permease [Paenarthrobacter nicotinovorans]